MITSPPKAWYDVHRFLKQGGYDGILQTWHLKKDKSWLLKASAMMQSKESHMKWLNQWVHVVFNEQNQECYPIPQPETIRMFFEIAKFTYNDNYGEALHRLNAFRKAYNLPTLSELPPPSVRCHRSCSLANGITAKQPVGGTNKYAGRHSFYEADSAAPVNRTHLIIPSGLHIPGYPRSDSPLSSLPDDDQVMEDSTSKRVRSSRKRASRKAGAVSCSSGDTSLQRSGAPLPTGRSRGMRLQRRNELKELIPKAPKEAGRDKLGSSCREKQVPLRSQGSEGGLALQPIGLQLVEKHFEASFRKRTDRDSSSNLDCLGEQPPSNRRRTCLQPFPQTPGPAVLTPPPIQLPSESEEVQETDTQRGALDGTVRPSKNTMGPPNSFTSTAAMIDTLNSSSVPLTIALQTSPSLTFESSSTTELMDFDATLMVSPPTRILAGLKLTAGLISHGSASKNPSGSRSISADHSETPLCKSNFVSTTFGSALEEQEPTSSLYRSTSPLERIDSEETLVFGQAEPSDSIELGNICNPGAFPPASTHPSLTAELHFNLIRRWSLVNSVENEPPWRKLSDLPSPPSDARPPGKGDTHFWSLPHSPIPVEQELIPLRLPDFPPQPSQPSLAFNKIHKPCLTMAPPVWAQSRQELCESLNYFRSYQGGVYTQKKRARGYLLDGHPAVQDIWNAEGRCIISHAGGNSAIDKETGQTVLVDDQTIHSTSCNALLNSWKFRQPIVLIAGNGYNLFPYDLEHRRYVVLGYYLIIHAWAEPEPSLASPRGYFVRWKFMFQWIQSQGKPWWIQPDTQSDGSPGFEPNILFSRICESCSHPSATIYKFGWVCTRTDCSMFFRRIDAPITSPEPSGYYPDFLALRDDPPEFQGLSFQIRPSLPVERKESGGREYHQAATSRHFWKGWWCEKCGRLSCREYWTHWECRTCHNKFKIKSIIQLPQYPVGNTPIQTLKDAGIGTKARRVRLECGSVRCQSFILPFNRGIIHLIQADDKTKSIADGIWRQYQVDAQEPGFFRRYSMKTHKLKGRLLSHYFSQNSGEPYEYVGGTDNTVPLDKYSSVSQALALIRNRASRALEQNPSFNEMLSAAYMAEQKMDFHSDGEKDLGPVIASLSLGSPATMRFRPVPSKWEAEEFPGRKSPPTVLTLTLRHGDVLIMEGADIQEYYQCTLGAFELLRPLAISDLQPNAMNG